MATIKVDVVSAEESIFSGDAELVSLPGKSGELGILPGHVPLITLIRPGFVRIHLPGKKEVEQVFVAGGVLEVQPDLVTVLLIRPSVAMTSTRPRLPRLLKMPAHSVRMQRAKSRLPASKPRWPLWPLRSWQSRRFVSSVKRTLFLPKRVVLFKYRPFFMFKIKKAQGCRSVGCWMQVRLPDA